MKLFVTVIFCILVVSPSQASDALEKIKTEVSNYAMECAKETGASDDEVNNFLGKNAVDSQAGHCMLFCVGKRTGFYGTDGKYSESGTKAFLEPLKNGDAALFDALLAIAEKCNKEVVVDADQCTTAARFHECSLKAQKEVIN